MSTTKLVAALDSPNGWQRDTAQRLLVHAQDKAAVAPLEKLVRKCSRAKTRMQALCTLDGLNALTTETILVGLHDSHPGVREQAVRLSETFLRQFKTPASNTTTNKLAETLLNMVDDPEIRVRYQLAFSLGEWDDPRAGRALALIALRDYQHGNKPESQFQVVGKSHRMSDMAPMETAVLSSATGHWNEMLETIFSRPQPPPPALIQALMAATSPMNNRGAFEQVLAELAKPRGANFAPWQLAALSGMIEALEHHASSLAKLYARSRQSLKPVIKEVDGIVAQARRGALDQTVSDEERIVCIRLLGRGLDRQEDDIQELGHFLNSGTSGTLEAETVERLGAMESTNAASALIGGWQGYGPEIRVRVLDTLLIRPGWTDLLLTALEGGRVSPGQVSAFVQQRLATHANLRIRERAKKLFESSEFRPAENCPAILGCYESKWNIPTRRGAFPAELHDLP
jgi:hypothetical protein